MLCTYRVILGEIAHVFWIEHNLRKNKNYDSAKPFVRCCQFVNQIRFYLET